MKVKIQNVKRFFLFTAAVFFLGAAGFTYLSKEKPVVRVYPPFDSARKSSFPFFTGDTWRYFCDWRLTENETFDPKNVVAGDTIFVEYQLLRQFRKMARKIERPFILITPNVEGFSDGPLPGPHEKLLKIKSLAAWFAMNIDRKPNSKLHPIPIGLSNTFWQQGDFSKIPSKNRDTLCYVNFDCMTNPEKRIPCWKYFEEKSWAKKRRDRSYQEYLEDLSQSIFVISPAGNGLDCHRTWEALCLKSYPVVLSSTLDPLYENLPVVIVQSWDEVTEEFLLKKKIEFDQKAWSFEKAFIPYWFEQVALVREDIRSKKPFFFNLFSIKKTP